ncbi:MAG: phosphatidate cytidylyltransferase [Clostridia bacterium]|nr:phosphatidate cytidylyltransferase [Clostridia bacterium]
MATVELSNATGISADKRLMTTAVAGTVFLVAAQFFGNTFFTPALYVYILAVFAVYMKNMGNIGLKEIAVTFFLSVYVAFMFGHLILVRNMYNGHLLVWLIFIGAFITDTAALFGGKFFGKHKLCPKLSPKKTVEGSISGVIGCILATLIYCLICQLGFGVSPHYGQAIIIALGSSIVSQVGDLAASCIKRQFGIKDYGKIMPGHGGVMDRFDSILFVAPFVYYMLLIFPIFG